MTQDRLCIKRGISSDLLSLLPGEPAYSTDTKHLHIGNVTGDINSYINSDQIDSQVSSAQKEISARLEDTQTQIEEIIRCNGLITDINLSQKTQLNQLLIDKINDSPLLMKSEHIVSNNVFNLEQTYTNLLKSSSFDFVSINGEINFNNGVQNSKPISIKIAGKTVQSSFVKAVLVNNGVSYPFYASLTDKINKKVIELGDGDTLEVSEDGRGVLIQNAATVVIAKEIMPAIVLQEDNLIYLDSNIAPSEFNIVAPINQIAHIEELLKTLEAKTSAVATLCTEV